MPERTLKLTSCYQNAKMLWKPADSFCQERDLAILSSNRRSPDRHSEFCVKVTTLQANVKDFAPALPSLEDAEAGTAGKLRPDELKSVKRPVARPELELNETIAAKAMFISPLFLKNCSFNQYPGCEKSVQGLLTLCRWILDISLTCEVPFWMPSFSLHRFDVQAPQLFRR